MSLTKTQKRTCNGCKALNQTDAFTGFCALSFNTKYKTNPPFGLAEFYPLDPCYKPMTLDKYIKARDFIDIERGNK